jgi:ubiquinone/menaquinone biosynthesis C-methylase UbiE
MFKIKTCKIVLLANICISMVSTQPVLAGKTDAGWNPIITSEFMHAFEQYRQPLVRLLQEMLPPGQEILEIGSGPLGGVLHYLEDRPDITPTEANPESFILLHARYPRAVHTDAQGLTAKLPPDRLFDTIFLANTLDCIMSSAPEETRKALLAMKRHLKPKGKIIALQYYNPALDLMAMYANGITSRYRVLPYQSRTKLSDGSGRSFLESALLLADRTKLPHPLNEQGINLKNWIDTVYPVGFTADFVVMLDTHPGAALHLMLQQEPARYHALASQLATIINPLTQEKRAEHGITRNPWIKILKNLLETEARATGLQVHTELHQVASASETSPPGASDERILMSYVGAPSWVHTAPKDPAHPKRTIEFVYTRMTLTVDDTGAAAADDLPAAAAAASK